MKSGDLFVQLPANLINYIVGAAVLLWITSRQVRKTPLNQKLVLGLVLLGVGALETITFIQKTPVKVLDLSLTVLSVLIGGVLAAVRAWTIRLWAEGNGDKRVVWQQGNWLTAALWIVGIGQHLLLDAFVAPGLGSTSLLLYFGLIIYAQRHLVIVRARALHLIP